MIHFYHVSKSYVPGSPVLTDVNLEIEKGEFVFITGESGAGKTTFLKMIFMEETPTEGHIIVDGQNITKLRASAVPYLRRNISFVFQDYRLLPKMTTFDNIAMPLEILGYNRATIKRKVLDITRSVKISHRLNYTPEKLSGGEQQRVAIARAVVAEPAIILADEPTGNLDSANSLAIISLLEDINVRGTTLVVATHNTGLIEQFRKRVIHIERGAADFLGDFDVV